MLIRGYKLVRKIGQGSFGIVNLYKSSDGELCVVKVRACVRKYKPNMHRQPINKHA